MAYIDDVLIAGLENLGFFDFLLPWLFVFAVVYGLLLKANIFGEVNKKISGILALIFAFFVAPYAGAQLSMFFTTIGATTTIVLAGILMFIILATSLGVDTLYKDKKHTLGAVVIISLVIFLISSDSAIRGFNLGSDLILTLVFIGALILGVWFVINSNGEEKQ